MTHRIIFLRGLPGSGKTTHALRLMKDDPNLVRVNRDDIRVGLFGKNKEKNKQQKKMVDDKEYDLVTKALADGLSVIVDSTNLPSYRREKYEKLARQYDAEFETADFTDVPLPTCLERNRNREAKVPEKVIRFMWKNHIRTRRSSMQYVVKGLPNCYVSDIDGTLADHEKRSSYDYDSLKGDRLNIGLAILLDVLTRRYWIWSKFWFQKPIHLILVSGRPDSHRKLTEEWLAERGIKYHSLFMRKAGDTRSDVEVKREIYENELKGKWNVMGVFDDRLRVQKLWWDLGIPLFGCQNPHDDNDF